jgi:hypothetical protein
MSISGTIIALVVFTLFYIPFHRFVFFVIVVFLAVVLLNNQFYLFLSSKRGRSFALAAIPFHLLYHFYNGLSFIAGSVRYFWKTGRLFSSGKAATRNTAAGTDSAKGKRG